MIPLEVYTVIKIIQYRFYMCDKCDKSESIWSFKLGFIVAMKYAFNILHTSLLLTKLQMTFQLKLWSILSLKCFTGFDLLLGLLYSIHLISTFLLVSPMYFSPQIHILSYILHAGCNDLSFNWKRVLIFLVNHFILTLNL